MNSSSSNNLLKIIFFVFIVILLAEIGYFFYIENKQNKERKTDLVKTFIPEPEIDSNSDFNIDFNKVTKFTLEDTAKAINLGILESSEIVNVFRGKLIAIEKENFDKYNLIEGYRPVLGLSLEVKPNVRPVSFLFNQEEYENALVEELSSSGSATPKTLEDLQINQMLEVIERYSLLDDNKLFQYKILITP